MSLPPLPRFAPFLPQSFPKSARNLFFPSSTSSNVGPGSYEIGGSMDQAKVVSFFPEDGSIMRKLKNNEDSMNPGPAYYDAEKNKKYGKSMVCMGKFNFFTKRIP
jgi:hypothetical protein